MSGKDKPGVTHRLNRGRSTQDSKSKTDSGCFVDEELERNGSSDSSQGSISSSPVKETDSKKVKAIDRKIDSVTPVSSPEPTIVYGNALKSALNGKENVMNKDRGTDDENESARTENADKVCDMVEKTRRASDFYCLYYSASPEGTLTKSEVVKVKSKPPVPPKPKTRRGSAPPSSFNNIESVCLRNKDITKRLSYNECQSENSKLSLENCEERDKRKSVEERILLFEAFAKNGLVESSFNNVQSSVLKTTTGNYTEARKASQSENGWNVVLDEQNELEKAVPLADSETFSFESSSNSESFNLSGEVQEYNAPLVEEDEFTVDGSILGQSTVNCDTVDGNCHSSNAERENLGFVNGIDEIEAPDHGVSDENENGGDITIHKRDKHFDQMVTEEKIVDMCGNDVAENCTGFKSFDASMSDDHQPPVVEIHSSFGEMKQVNDCNNSTTLNLESVQGRGVTRNLMNPRVNEIRQELLRGSRRQEGNGRQSRPGSIAGISNLEKDFTSQMKRRSWSFSEPQPAESSSPFVQKVHQVPAPKLTTSSWQSEDGLSSPFVRSVRQTRPAYNTPSVSQERIGLGSQHRPGLTSFEHSGYTSDDSSVHSEPLFQPMRRRPQSLNNGHIFKSVSYDSSISTVDTLMPSLAKMKGKRFGHSLGSRDPVHALRRQSAEFGEDSPHFQPVSHVQVPHLQNLRRTWSTASSSSDSEVERIFSRPEAAAPVYPQFPKPNIHDGLGGAVSKRKVSAMEALFGPQSSSKTCSVLSSDSEQSRQKTLSERFSKISSQHQEDVLLPEELAEELIEFDETEQKEIWEPGLEFDDTDYSEFYTRCEDKHSIITAEALSIKKLLQSPQTVPPDPDIESVVMSVTKRKVLPPQSEDLNTPDVQDVSCNDDTIDTTSFEPQICGECCRQHRGTQTPPAEVFRALSPPSSVGTQTPPMSLSQELLPPSLLKELQRDLQAPAPTLQEKQSSSLELFRAVSPASTPFADTDMLLSLQSSDKAVSVEELLQILANMRVGPPEEAPKRRPVSVQKYNSSPTQNVNSRTSTNSLPSSWHHLDSPAAAKQNGSGDFKQPSGIPPRSSKSYDCVRRGIVNKDKRSRVIQAQAVGNRESNENIRQKLKEWHVRSQLFEEEVECLEEKRKLLKANGEKVLNVSYDGSQSTENIETESKLTRTHSLKRPRKDRAFSQKERNEPVASSFDEKQRISFPTETETSDGKISKGSEKSTEEVKDSLLSSEAEGSKLEITSDSFLVEMLQNAANESQMHEVASPEGVDVFIDYRRRNGMHITSTPKPPPYPDKSLLCGEGGMGKTNIDKPAPDSLNASKPVSGSATEEVPTDLESQGDASSSSYSSDDDRFGEFFGSTDTVVFVDTEPSSGISLVPDLDALDLKLVGSNNLLSIDSDEDEKDEDRLDVLLGEVRRSLNLEFVDSDILDKAIERFKQRVSPRSENKVGVDNN